MKHDELPPLDTDDAATDAEKNAILRDAIDEAARNDPTRFTTRSFAVLENKDHSLRLINRDDARRAISIPWDELSALRTIIDIATQNTTTTTAAASPTTPSDAAMRAAEEIVKLTHSQDINGGTKRITAEVAAIITRHLVAAAPVGQGDERETFAVKHFTFGPCFHSMVQRDCPSCCQSHAARMEMQLGKLEASTALPIRERVEKALREHMAHCYQVYKGVPPTVDDWSGGALHYVVWGLENDIPLPAATTSPETPPPPYDGSMTSEQLERAALVAESRGIDLETAQELVYLRDRAVAIPQSFEEAQLAKLYEDPHPGYDCAGTCVIHSGRFNAPVATTADEELNDKP